MERRVMEFLLAGDLPVLSVLRKQYAAASITGRDFSGVGVFTKFQVPTQVERVTPPGFTISDIAYELSGVQNGGSAVLFIPYGALDLLELYNWTDDWPQDLK